MTETEESAKATILEVPMINGPVRIVIQGSSVHLSGCCSVSVDIPVGIQKEGGLVFISPLPEELRGMVNISIRPGGISRLVLDVRGRSSSKNISKYSDDPLLSLEGVRGPSNEQELSVAYCPEGCENASINLSRIPLLVNDPVSS